MTPTQRFLSAWAGAPTEAGGGDALMANAPVTVPLPEVAGVLTAAQVEQTAASIAAVQRHDGMIPWSDGGHCDPWNHTEAARCV